VASDQRREEGYTRFYFMWWIPLMLWYIALSVLSLYCDPKTRNEAEMEVDAGADEKSFLQPENGGGIMGVVRWEGILIGKSRRGEGGGGVIWIGAHWVALCYILVYTVGVWFGRLGREWWRMKRVYVVGGV
jgi:hypothetical protein